MIFFSSLVYLLKLYVHSIVPSSTTAASSKLDCTRIYHNNNSNKNSTKTVTLLFVITDVPIWTFFICICINWKHILLLQETPIVSHKWTLMHLSTKYYIYSNKFNKINMLNRAIHDFLLELVVVVIFFLFYYIIIWYNRQSHANVL